MNKTTIFLIRHGQAKYNKLLGRRKTSIVKDGQLTEKGRDQALKLADFLQCFKISKFYGSTTKSAVQTMKIIASLYKPYTPLFYSDELNELRLGDKSSKDFNFYSSLRVYLRN